jgi:arabinogalactan oligomer/maltooligosaccharide transport system permease protein
MAIGSKWRKALMVLAFIGPTLLGILIFNIYPIVFNTFISFTNRNKYHPNPDCSISVTRVLEPTCWAVFQEHARTGIAQPYVIQKPWYQNYFVLIGQLFTRPVVLAVGTILLCFVPLIIARKARQGDKPICTCRIGNYHCVIFGIWNWLALKSRSSNKSHYQIRRFFRS